MKIKGVARYKKLLKRKQRMRVDNGGVRKIQLDLLERLKLKI